MKELKENAMMLGGGAHFVGPILYSEEVQQYGQHLIDRILSRLTPLGQQQIPEPDPDIDLTLGELIVDEQSISFRIVELVEPLAQHGKIKALLIMFTREVKRKYHDG